MKRCPECRRDYFDDSLLYCLDDGRELLEGPSSGNEADTAIFSPKHTAGTPSLDPETKQAYRRLSDPPGNKRSVTQMLLPYIGGAILLLAAAFGGYMYLRSGPNDRVRSIAVLPFVNESGTQDLEYIADGLPETLIYRLSQLPELVVAPRSSAFRFKGKQIDVGAVGTELGTDAVLTGDITKRGEILVINVELVDVRTKRLIWGEQFSRGVADLLSTQRDIANRVTDSLRVKMTSKVEQAVSKQYTTSGEAYQLYLKGRYHWSKRAAPELHAAIDDFQQAISADPNFALAYTGLADAYSVLAIYDPQASAVASMPLAKAAVDKALLIDDNLAQAHASRAIVLDIFDWNTTDAEKEYRRAIEIDGAYVAAHQWYGEMLCNLGRFDEGLEESRKAVELEPFYLPGNFALGINLYKARRYDEALGQLARVEELSPEYTDVNAFKYEIYAAKGQYDKAVELFVHQGVKDGEPLDRMQELRHAFDLAGWPGFLRARIKQIESGAAPTAFSAAATTYAYAGEVKKAVEWLNKSVLARNEGMTWLLVDPKFDNLRADPGFQEVVKRVGFAD